MRPNLFRDGNQHFIEVMTENVRHRQPQDSFPGTVAQHDLVLDIRCDHTAGNGSKDVVHQVFETGHFCKGLPERCKQAGVFYGYRGLV